MRELIENAKEKNSKYGIYGSVPEREAKSSKVKISYLDLLRKNSNYRYFLFAYLVNKMGEWMTYLASISMIQDITAHKSLNQGDSTKRTNTLISILILVKLLPNVFFLPIGGILADSYDRRKIQVGLDLCMSCVVVIFLWSLWSKSIFLCFLANFLIEISSGLYTPSNQAMLPHLFANCRKEEKEDQLKKATVLYGISWSLMAAVGSSIGGILVAAFGIKGCFVIDSITYVISAILLWFGVQGDYNVSKSLTKDDGKPLSPTSENLSLLENQDKTENNKSSTIDSEHNGNNGDLFLYIGELKVLFVKNPLVGACALLKGSAALANGAVDVLNVNFSLRGSGLKHSKTPLKTSLKLGMLFRAVGVGCLLGSMVTDTFSDLAFPRRIARVTLCGFACISLAMFWMATTPESFLALCLSTVIRSIGSSVVWVNSTLLIQKFTPKTLLGRVSSFDSGVALFAEAISALVGGMMLDREGFSPEELSLVIAGIAMLFFFLWSPLAFQF